MPSSRRQSQKAFSRARAGSQNLARVFSRRSYVHSCSLSRRKCRERLPEKRFALTKVVRRFVCNQQYSIIALTDDTGAVTERYAYDAYGKPTFMDAAGTEISGSADGNRILYTGREYEDKIGIYYYRARWYSPELGRFLSRDPIGFAGSKWNLYEYGGTNPGRFIDPLGLELTASGPQIEAARKNCKNACLSMVPDCVKGGFSTELIRANLAEIVTEAMTASIDGVIFDIDNFTGIYMPSDPALEGDWELWLEANLNGDGSVVPEGALHSALRHCYASALLAKKYGCACSKCLGDWREYPDFWSGSQPLRNTQAQLYNNFAGRGCAGCTGVSAGGNPKPTYYPYTGPMISYPTDKNMLGCCIDKARNGQLDIAVENTVPLGNGTPVIVIPPQSSPIVSD